MKKVACAVIILIMAIFLINPLSSEARGGHGGGGGHSGSYARGGHWGGGGHSGSYSRGGGWLPWAVI